MVTSAGLEIGNVQQRCHRKKAGGRAGGWAGGQGFWTHLAITLLIIVHSNGTGIHTYP